MPKIYLTEKELDALVMTLEDTDHEILRAIYVKLERYHQKHHAKKNPGYAGWSRSLQPTSDNQAEAGPGSGG